MKRSESAILTTHVGSLVRPVEIRKALLAQQMGRPFADDTFQMVLTASVRDVVRQQAEVGLDIPSDGEFGKAHWIGYVRTRLSGVDLSKMRPPPSADKPPPLNIKDRVDFADFYRAYEPVQRYDWIPPEPGKPLPNIDELSMMPTPHFTGEVKYIGHDALARDIDNFRAALTNNEFVEAFMPTASPMAVEMGKSNPHYRTDEEFLYAIADALREEYKAIVDAGFLLQVDDAWLPITFDLMRDRPREEVVNIAQHELRR